MSLKEINTQGNPMVEEKGDEFKKEVLIILYEALPNIKKINGDIFSNDEINDALIEKANRIRA